jgi:DNA repair exonuclease SbcCD ATPase subunit
MEGGIKMATKDQERKALEEIKAIVEKVGGDQSYIGMAFKGCFEIAEDNIVNDFGDSWMDRWSSIVDENNKHIDEIRNLQKQVEERERLDIRRQDDITKCHSYEEELNDLIRDLQRDKDQLQQGIKEYETENNDLGERNKELEYENMTLKAKLYDMMTA